MHIPLHGTSFLQHFSVEHSTPFCAAKMNAYVVFALLVAYAQAGNIVAPSYTGVANTASVAEARAGGSFSYNLKEGGSQSIAHHTVAHVPTYAATYAAAPAVHAVAAPVAHAVAAPVAHAVAAPAAVSTYGALPYAHGYGYAHGLGYAGLGYAGHGYAGLGYAGLGYAGLGYAGHGYNGAYGYGYNNLGSVPYGLGLEGHFDNGAYRGDYIYL